MCRAGAACLEERRQRAADRPSNGPGADDYRASHGGSGLRRRERPRDCPRRGHPVARGASHPCGRGGRHQHGRPDWRCLCLRDGCAGTAGPARLAELGRAVRRVDLRLQEHPPQDRRARVSLAAGVRTQGRHRAPHVAQQRRVRRVDARPHLGALPRNGQLRQPADAVPDRRGGSRHGAPGRDPARLAGRRHARHDVAAPDLSPGDPGRADPGGWRHDEQRTRRRREGDGCRQGDRDQRRRPVGPRVAQLHAARRRRFHARRDDAVHDPHLAGIGRCDHQRAAGQVRLAGLAPGRRTGRGGLQGGRSDARTAPAARGQRGRLRRVARRAPAAAGVRGARAALCPSGGVRHQRREAARGAARAPRRRAPRHRGHRSRSRRAHGARSLRDDHVAHHARRGRPSRACWCAAARRPTHRRS